MLLVVLKEKEQTFYFYHCRRAPPKSSANFGNDSLTLNNFLEPLKQLFSDVSSS